MNEFNEHERFSIRDPRRVCVATEGEHECDLVNVHTSRHMCVCGRYFGD